MIDFIKIFYRDKSSLENYMDQEGNFEDVGYKLDLHSGEIMYPHWTDYENMHYVVNKKRGYIKGSLHKLYNKITLNEDQNYNDFTYSRLCQGIDYLLKKIVDVENSSITQLEFGLNINTSMPAEKLIRRNILMHNHKGYNHNMKYQGRGELKQFDHSNYVIKIYDKAKQYRVDRNILRVELKFVKAKEFQKTGVFNLMDLKNKNCLRKLFLVLIKRFDELTIIDDIQLQGQDGHDLIQYRNPRFWEDLSEKNKRQTKLRRNRNFERIISEYALGKTKHTLRFSLFQKYLYLINN